MELLRQTSLGLLIAFAAGIVFSSSPALASEAATEGLESTLLVEKDGSLREFLFLPRVGKYGRAAIHRDPIDAAIARGLWTSPKEGDLLEGLEGFSSTWRAITTGEGGVTAANAGGGYAFVTVDSSSEKVMILEATRHAAACVNGEWITGDPYGWGWVRLPILLREGANELLFHLAQPGFKASLSEPEAEVFILQEDATLPDVIDKSTEETWGAVPVVNASLKPMEGAVIVASVDGAKDITTPLPRVEPLTIHKARFLLPGDIPHHDKPLLARITVRQTPDSDANTSKDLATADLPLRRVGRLDLQTRTFISRIDGAVQAYSVLPAATEGPSEDETGLLLTLHGAGVDHREQAGRFSAKSWAHLVAPQNRRPFGFDWEEWGALDAMEALQDARRHYRSDPKRTYVSGHAMGGHGAWRLGTLYPDEFAAIGPNAGWLSFRSYGRKTPVYDQPSPVESMLVRAASPSDTIRMVRNLISSGVYVLHGSGDKNVPVSQSRYMRTRLGEFHGDFVYHERSNTGHKQGGSDCDWPPMMDFFQSHRSPAPDEVKNIDFTTLSPGLASRCYWATILAQRRAMEPSRIVLQFDPSRKRMEGRTENVSRMSIDANLLTPGKSMPLRLDGNQIRVAATAGKDRIWLARNPADQWRQVRQPSAFLKNPDRYGGFKSGFDHNALLVYGTQGDNEENAWAKAKARFDAQSFWCRGNGAFQVIPDTDFDANAEPNRNVVLYGCRETNAAYPALLSTSNVQVSRGRIYVDIRPEMGDDLAVLMIRPRPGSDQASVALIGGTGIVGKRLTNRLRYFVSGVGFPDLMIFGPDALTAGESDLRALGYFGPDWGIESSEIVWRDLAF